MNSHMNQSKGSAINHFGALSFHRPAATPTTATITSNAYAHSIGQGKTKISSKNPSGFVTHFSIMGGLPNFSRDRPRNTPNRTAKIFCHNPSSVPEFFGLATCGGADGFCPTFITDAISTNQLPAPVLPEHSCTASDESAPLLAVSPPRPPPKPPPPLAQFPQSPETSIVPNFHFEFRTSNFE